MHTSFLFVFHRYFWLPKQWVSSRQRNDSQINKKKKPTKMQWFLRLNQGFCRGWGVSNILDTSNCIWMCPIQISKCSVKKCLHILSNTIDFSEVCLLCSPFFRYISIYTRKLIVQLNRYHWMSEMNSLWRIWEINTRITRQRKSHC